MDNQSLKELLLEKSVGAFILGLEIFNKPTIKYRVEGFSFFICNAWELMLKAELINRNIPLYYKNNPDRTISLTDAIKKIYSDENIRIRLNLEKIVDLRNMSTHFITEEYELKYIPLFQSCVFNYEKEMERRHGIKITDYIPHNFLALTAHIEPYSNEEIRIKYPPEIAEKLIKKSNEIRILADQFDSDHFAVSVQQNLYITRKKDQADFHVSIENGADNKVRIVKELKDPANTHPLSFSVVITLIKERMNKLNLRIDNEKGFTKIVLRDFISFYQIKENPKYCYEHKVGNTTTYTYSQEVVNFIIDEVRKNQKNFYTSLKNKKR